MTEAKHSGKRIEEMRADPARANAWLRKAAFILGNCVTEKTYPYMRGAIYDLEFALEDLKALREKKKLEARAYYKNVFDLEHVPLQEFEKVG